MIALAAIPFVGPALAFLTSPLGRLVGVGLLVASAYGAGVWKGHSVASGKCEAAALRAELAAAHQDLNAEKMARAEDQAALEVFQKKDETNAEDLQKLQEELAKRPAAARCELSDPDARRLR